MIYENELNYGFDSSMLLRMHIVANFKPKAPACKLLCLLICRTVANIML